MDDLITPTKENNSVTKNPIDATSPLNVVQPQLNQSEVPAEIAEDQQKQCSSETITKNTTEKQNHSTSEADKKSAYLQKAKKIAADIIVGKIGGSSYYDLKTIKQVHEKSIELAEEDYKSLVLKERQKRRALMETDLAGYQKLIIGNFNEVQKVVTKAQDAIVEALQIPLDDFKGSVVHLFMMSSQNSQEIIQMQVQVFVKIKERIPATKDLTVEIVKEILKFQLETLTQKPEPLKQIFLNISNSPNMFNLQLNPDFLGCFLDDQVFKKFQIEEQDGIKALKKPEISSDKDIIFLRKKNLEIMSAIMIQLSGRGMPVK